MTYQDVRDKLHWIAIGLERGTLSRTLAASDLRKLLQSMNATDIAKSLDGLLYNEFDP